MRLLMMWTRGAALLIALAGAAAGEVTLSRSNDPSGGLTDQMAILLGQEKAAMRALDAGRLEQILSAPGPIVPGIATAAGTATVDPAVSIPQQNAVRPTPAKPGLFSFRARAAAKAATKAVPAVPTYDAAWLATQPVVKGGAEWACLAKAVYFEARGEPLRGQVGVAEVVLNRAASGLYPRSICGVVNQGSKYACQFSFVCDGNSDVMRERGAAIVAGKIASLMMAGTPRLLTDGATHFHTGAVRPRWSKTFPRTAKIGSHYFYRQPTVLASN